VESKHRVTTVTHGLHWLRWPLLCGRVESAPSPPSDPSPVELDLQTCSAQEYLARTVYPLLAPAMQLLDDVRPADPVEYLALQLSKEAQTQRERVHQLNQIHHIREQLREQFRQEYSVAGRV